MPDADLKIYLDASPEERAWRRYLELLERGDEADYEEILGAMKRRDRIDTDRAVAPLKAAEDAIRVNTDNLSINEVLSVVEGIIEDVDSRMEEQTHP
jgi:cytidylate kinase